MREIEDFAPIPVIFITGSAAEVRARLANQTVINKPFSEQTLTYAIEASLHG